MRLPAVRHEAVSVPRTQIRGFRDENVDNSMFGIFFRGICSCTNRTFLSTAEVQQLASGKKWIHVRSGDKRKIQWDLRSDGGLYGSNFEGGRDSGIWLVNEHGHLCVKWRGVSTNRCIAVHRDGEKFVMVDTNDLNGIYGELTIE